MKEAGFEVLDHGSDLRLKAWGVDAPSTLRNLLRGVMELAVKVETVRAENVVEFEVKAPEFERLVVRAVNEMIYLMDAERMVFKDADVEVHFGSCVTAKVRLYGDRVDRRQHELRVQPKAATYGNAVVTPHLVELTIDV
ncbi:MAG: archease [Bacillota bacterium]